MLEHSRAVGTDELLRIDGVRSVSAPSPRYPRVDALSDRVEIAGVAVGRGCPPVLMAGPCSVEDEDRIDRLAARVAAAGARFLRGGAFKPRTSPHEFQGIGRRALRWLRDAADRHGLAVVTEALSERTVDEVAEFADLIQIGSRNMHNGALLRAAGASGRPVLVKRGMAATLDEWLGAAEYCLEAGAPAVIFCERGIRGFDRETRNLLDLASVALLAYVRRLPVIVDPSHALGRRDLVAPLARAALAAGAHGLLVEVHDAPDTARSDGAQALDPDDLSALLPDPALPAAADRSP
ncbi:MAG: 3-deoxy-7-phosphoheptulonate synthase [Acidobacteria bacterium]|nr:MAG: 3-deoxy-7-phosphoheptulonate synthase [Acidobacteriota bacterium]